MNKLLLILILIMNSTCFSQTQREMQKEANEQYKKADLELNAVYKKILVEYKSDATFINALKKTQRIWIAYRNAELEMKFPAENKQVTYGSIYAMCESLFLKELTEERTNKLKIWLNGIEEGEVCLGSVKMKSEIHSNK